MLPFVSIFNPVSRSLRRSCLRQGLGSESVRRLGMCIAGHESVDGLVATLIGKNR